MRLAAAFTLIEALIVVVLIALLSAIAIPNILNWRSAAKLRGAAENLKSDLELAKLSAIEENGAVAVKFYENAYELFVDNDKNWIPDKLVMKNTLLPPGVRIDFDQSTFLSDRDDDGAKIWPLKTHFIGRGTADNGTAVLVDSTGNRKRITVSTFSKITIKTP